MLHEINFEIGIHNFLTDLFIVAINAAFYSEEDLLKSYLNGS